MTLRWVSAGVGLLILGAVATFAQQPSPQPHPPPSQPSAQQQAAKPANIDRNGVLMLIRSTLLALDHANKSGNYTVLRDLGASGVEGDGGVEQLLARALPDGASVDVDAPLPCRAAQELVGGAAGQVGAERGQPFGLGPFRASVAAEAGPDLRQSHQVGAVG